MTVEISQLRLSAFGLFLCYMQICLAFAVVV